MPAINEITAMNSQITNLVGKVDELIALRQEKVQEIKDANAQTLAGITSAQQQALAAIDAQLALAKQDLINSGAMNYFTYFEASKPLLNTNPEAVGATWYDTSSGICYTCTDNTSGANVWRGSDGSQVSPNTPPTAPDLSDFITSCGGFQSFSYTPKGATDSDGTVAFYEVVSITPALLTASPTKVAAGEAISFQAGAVNAQTSVAISIRAIDDKGQAGTAAVATVNLKPVMAGAMGELGAGVGINHAAATKCGLTPMNGCDDVSNENFGNYVDGAQNVFVCVPAFSYKIDNEVTIAALSPRRKVEVSYNLAEEGFIPHPAFKKSDGSYVECVFVSKYQLSNSKGVDASGGVAASKKLGDPVCSYTYSAASQYNSFSRLTGKPGVTPIDQNKGAFDVVKTMGENYCLHHELLFGAYAILCDAHLQAALAKYGSLGAIPRTICAWADIEPYEPKGCNNNALADHADTALTFTKAAYSNKALAGSANNMAKTTHNGQLCGIADLNGNMWEINSGHLNIGGTHYVIKGIDKLKELTAANYEETSRYDVVDMSDRASANNYVGNGTNAIYSATAAKAVQDALRAVDAGRSASGVVAYGQDCQYALAAGGAPICGGAWYSGSNAGVRARNCSGWASYGAGYGLRALLVPSA